MALDGVVGYSDEHIWQHSSKVVCCTLRLQVKRDCGEQKITAQVNKFLSQSLLIALCYLNRITLHILLII